MLVFLVCAFCHFIYLFICNTSTSSSIKVFVIVILQHKLIFSHSLSHTHTHTKLTFGLFILSVGIRDDEHHRCGYQLCLDWFIPTSESIFPWIRHSADPHCGGNRGNIFFCPYTMITYNLLLQWPKLSIRWHQWVVFVLCLSVKGY